MIYIIVLLIALIIYAYFISKTNKNIILEAFLTKFYIIQNAPISLADVYNKYLIQYHWIQSQTGYSANSNVPNNCSSGNINQAINILSNQIKCNVFAKPDINIAIMLFFTSASLEVDIMSINNATPWKQSFIYDPKTTLIQNNAYISQQSMPNPIKLDAFIPLFNKLITSYQPTSADLSVCATCVSLMS